MNICLLEITRNLFGSGYIYLSATPRCRDIMLGFILINPFLPNVPFKSTWKKTFGFDVFKGDQKGALSIGKEGLIFYANFIIPTKNFTIWIFELEFQKINNKNIWNAWLTK